MLEIEKVERKEDIKNWECKLQELEHQFKENTAKVHALHKKACKYNQKYHDDVENNGKICNQLKHEVENNEKIKRIKFMLEQRIQLKNRLRELSDKTNNI